MRKIEIYREPKVFVFGNPYITTCTKEENKTFFDNTINIDSIIYKSKFDTHNKLNFIYNNIDNTLENLKDNKILIEKITVSIALSLFIASNPTSCFATSFMEEMTNIGTNLVGVLSVGITKGLLIITALRLFNEYINGANYYRIFNILKESIALILAIVVIPKLPIIVNTFIK